MVLNMCCLEVTPQASLVEAYRSTHIRLQPYCHTAQLSYDPIFMRYRLLNVLSAGHVLDYRHVRTTSLYTIIVFVPSGKPRV